MMDAAFEFSFNGLNMEFAINLAADGHRVSDLLFVDIMTEKCQLLHQYIKSSKDCLMLVANLGCKMATIKLFDKNLMDSQLFHCTISHLWDLEEQLYRLWIEVCGVLKDYATQDPLAELRHITDYYSSSTYQDMMHPCLL